MSIFESIKSERKLSMQHWRYRILHWCFNITDPQPGYTGLPRYLYTHYCPLFHITNLIAILSPLILLIKILIVACKILGDVAAYVMSLFDKINLAALWPKFEKTEKEEVHTRDNELQFMRNSVNMYPNLSFDSFWISYSYKFSLIKEDDAKLIYEKYQAKALEMRKYMAERAEKRRQRWLFWINFSSVFIKWAMNAMYIGLALLTIYIVYCFTIPVLQFLWWLACALWDINLLSILLITIKYLFIFSLPSLIILMLYKITWSRKYLWAAIVAVCTAIAKVCPSSTLVVPVVQAPFLWAIAGFVNTKDFIAMFYKENCPPIVIVSEEEEKMENQ